MKQSSSDWAIRMAQSNGAIWWVEKKYYAYWKEYQALVMTRVIALALGYSGAAS